MALERILGTDKGKEAFYKSDRNFSALQAEIFDPSYSASIVKQEPVFSLGTDVIKGQVPINAKGLSAVNMVKNGNFVNTNNWIGSTLSVANNEGTFTSLSQWGYLAQIIRGVINDKIYYSALVKTESNLIRLGINYAGGYDAGNIAHSGSGNYEKISSIATIPAIPSINYPQILVQDFRTSGWTAIKAKNVLAINLTAMFGATIANALTKDQCDKMFANWFDGIGSVNNVRIKSVGKNLLDLITGSYYTDTGVPLLSVRTSFSHRYGTIAVKPNTTYKVTLSQALQYNLTLFNANKTNIAGGNWSGNAVISFDIVTTLETGYIGIAFKIDGTTEMLAQNYNIQIEEGTVATPYEPYQESISYIPKLCSLPNGVKDESVEGKSIKRIGEKTLVASDITSLYSLVNQDLARVSSASLGITNSDLKGTVMANGWNTDQNVAYDSINDIGAFTHKYNVNYLDFIVAKGTYASLAAAQAALAGTKIIYELATPIISDLVTPLTVFPKGTISVESDFETTIPELTLRYPIDIAGVIDKLNDGVNQNSKLINTLDAKADTHIARIVAHATMITRDVSVAGVQVVVLPFKAKALTLFSVVDATKMTSSGTWGENNIQQSIYSTNIGEYRPANIDAIVIATDQNILTIGDIQNVTNTGFEINWVKIGLPTSKNATVFILATTH